jgi:RNA polymerase sigma-70 factor (sigma-E family)
MDDVVGRRVADAIRAWCHPRASVPSSVPSMSVAWAMTDPGMAVPFDVAPTAHAPVAADGAALHGDDLVLALYRQEATALVRLARLFVDDLNAAEDLVQEAFIRLARNTHRIEDTSRAAAYVRSIVLNLARDHNRRGLVSLRHQLPIDDTRAAAEEEIVLRDDQRRVLDAVRDLPQQQRNCVVLRYYEELGIAAIAEVLGISENSVKTHLKRGMAALARELGEEEEA